MLVRPGDGHSDNDSSSDSNSNNEGDSDNDGDGNNDGDGGIAPLLVVRLTTAFRTTGIMWRESKGYHVTEEVSWC
jgi:hypothetical protein